MAPKLILDLHKGLAGRFSIQIPVADGLNGDQEEPDDEVRLLIYNPATA